MPSDLSAVYPEPLTDFYGKNFLARVAGTDEMVRLIIGNKGCEYCKIVSDQ